MFRAGRLGCFGEWNGQRQIYRLYAGDSRLAICNHMSISGLRRHSSLYQDCGSGLLHCRSSISQSHVESLGHILHVYITRVCQSSRVAQIRTARLVRSSSCAPIVRRSQGRVLSTTYFTALSRRNSHQFERSRQWRRNSVWPMAPRNDPKDQKQKRMAMSLVDRTFSRNKTIPYSVN